MKSFTDNAGRVWVLAVNVVSALSVNRDGFFLLARPAAFRPVQTAGSRFAGSPGRTAGDA